MRRTRHRYGAHRWQVGDLWLPEDPTIENIPVVVLIHGGYWRTIYTKALMTGLARAVTEHNLAAWNIEYRRMGALGGGGWPTTLEDVGAAVDHLRQLPSLDLARVVFCGHSAGGQLALWAAGRARAATTAGPAPSQIVRPKAAVSLAGLVDLALAAELGLGHGSVERFLGGTPKTRPERYRAASPLALLPLGVPQLLVHGRADSVVPCSMSERYAETAIALGDDAQFVAIEGADHRSMIDPAGLAWTAVSAQLGRLLDLP